MSLIFTVSSLPGIPARFRRRLGHAALARQIVDSRASRVVYAYRYQRGARIYQESHGGGAIDHSGHDEMAWSRLRTTLRPTAHRWYGRRR
jgi:hypothetical protein